MDNQQSTEGVTPVPTTQIEQQPQLQAPYTPPTAAKKFPWLWVLLSALALLIVAGIILFVTFIYPQIQAKAVATGFMEALRKGDSSKIKDLTGEDTSSSFFTAAESGLKNASYTIASTTKKDAGYVVNFDVSGSSAIKDTSIKVSDNNKVTAFNLNVRNTVSSKIEGGTATVETPSNTGQTPAVTCLTASDLKANTITSIYDDWSIKYGQTSDGRGLFLTHLFFLPDSAVYKEEMTAETSSEMLAKIRDFYKANLTKDYTFSVYGFVHQATSTSAGVQLANDRSAKVKSDLIAMGIPSSKITIGSPSNAADSTVDPDIERKIEVDLIIPSNCTK